MGIIEGAFEVTLNFALTLPSSSSSLCFRLAKSGHFEGTEPSITFLMSRYLYLSTRRSVSSIKAMETILATAFMQVALISSSGISWIVGSGYQAYACFAAA